MSFPYNPDTPSNSSKESLTSLRNDLEDQVMKLKKSISSFEVSLSSISYQTTNNGALSDIITTFHKLTQDLSTIDSNFKSFTSQLTSSNFALTDSSFHSKQQSFQSKFEKILSQTKSTFKGLNSKVKIISDELSSRQNIIIDDNNTSYDNPNPNENEIEENTYLIPKQQILNLNHLMNDNDKKIDSIYHKTLLVNQLSSEVNEITLQQEHKLNDIEDNIIDLQKTTKDTLNTVIKEQEHQHNNKNNNCCIAFFILLFIVFIILITFQ